MKLHFLYACILFSTYILSAFATTDILRLLKGSQLPLLTKSCYCPNCHHTIPLSGQIPIFSYYINNGQCRFCKKPIPKTEHYLETFLFATMCIFNVTLRFSFTSFFCIATTYESVKLLFLVHYGKRESNFWHELGISTALNILLFSLLAMMYGLCSTL